MEISLRYTPVTGRLHTRYAPVRRSSPKYCYLALPLDLHVLSLPLAFILSQDQTLHCKNCLFYLFDSSSCPPPYLYMMADTRYLYLLIMSNSFRFQPRFLRRKTDAKVQTFSKLQKYFFKITVGVGLFALIVMLLCYENFFCGGARKGVQKGVEGRFSRFFGGVSAKKRGFRGDFVVYCYG